MITIKLDSKITLDCPNNEVINLICSANTFDNPKYFENEQNNRSNWNTDRYIQTYSFEDSKLVLPRGYMRDLMKLLKDHSITYQIIDERTSIPVPFPEKLNGIELRPYQQRAVEAANRYDQGAIISPTGSGKSIIGLEIIRCRQERSLIIVHRSDLATQWANLIQDKLGMKAGFIGGGDFEIGDKITIGMVQTLSSCENELGDLFGLVLADECHHLPSQSFFNVIGRLGSKFRYGLSATVDRRDKLEKIIYLGIGNAIEEISSSEVEDVGAVIAPTVYAVKTGFSPSSNSWNEYQTDLSMDSHRNEFIIDLTRNQNVPVLVICDRVAHAENLSAMLSRRNIDHVLAHGTVDKRDTLLERIKASHITVATTSLIGEGIDVSVWGILVMASPISSEIKLMQAIGRIRRPSAGKEKAIVYDLQDNCGFSGASFKKRFEIYRKHRIWVQFRDRD